MVGRSSGFGVASLGLFLAIGWGIDRSVPTQLPPERILQALLPALTFPAEVVSCHDGDTVLVEVRWRANVRLVDCWAKELTEPGGKQALEHLQRLTSRKKCLLSIPLDGARTVGDVLTFGRIIGEIWMDDQCESVNMLMVKDGFATREKQR